MALFDLIPSRHGTFHYTKIQSYYNAKFGIYGGLGCALADFGFSIYGVFQGLQWLNPTSNFWLSLGYVGLGTAFAYIVVMQIRHGNLRLTSYYPTIRRIRGDKAIQKHIAEEAVEEKVLTVQKLGSDVALVLAWIYAIGSNIYGLRFLWGAVAPVFAGAHGAPAIIKALIGIIAIVGFSFLFPYQGHVGEFAGFHFLENAGLLKAQEDNMNIPAPRSLPKP